MEMTGRVALITGGRRIGAVVAAELARRGGDIALVYRSSRAEAEETARSVEALGRRAAVVQADLATDELVETLGNGVLSQAEAEALIMWARAHWFAGEEETDSAAEDVNTETAGAPELKAGAGGNA